MPTYVFLAGIRNSGPAHWQRLWQTDLGGVWVDHANWDMPDRDAWVADLEAALQSVDGPKLVIAHSLGCALLAEWARDHSDPQLAGALLVAPPEIASDLFRGFHDAFDNHLPCRAIMVASEDDPYADIDYTRRLAIHWQAKLVEIGAKGHINADSGLDGWEEGRRILEALARGPVSTQSAGEQRSEDVMTYEVLLTTTLPRTLAAVRRTVKLSELGAQIGGILGEVWTFLRENKVKSTGHNVVLYLSASGEGADRTVDAWFGVEVHETIPASDNVKEVSTPAGRAASTIHWGQYTGVPDAHAAVRDWCKENGYNITVDWEVYGDWNDDWAKVRTDVFYHLQA